MPSPVGRLRNVRDLDHLPDDTDMEALSVWYDWANQITQEDLVDLRRIIHGSGKFMLCHNGATWRPGSFHPQYRFSDGFMVEYSEQFYQRLLRALSLHRSEWWVNWKKRPRRLLPYPQQPNRKNLSS